MDQEKMQTLDCWAVLELFGHQKVAGHLTTQMLGAACLLRMDIPEFEVDKRDYDYEKHCYQNVHIKFPTYTRYFGVGAIYAITPCSEEFARKAVAGMSSPPAICLEISRQALPPAPPIEPSFDIKDNSDDESATCEECGALGEHEIGCPNAAEDAEQVPANDAEAG